MQHKFRLSILIIILSLVVVQVMANNDILISDDNCPETMQYLPVGMDVHYAPHINPGVISNGYVDPAVISNLHTYYMALLQAEFPTASLLTSLPDLDEIQEAPTPIQLTGNYYCAQDGITAVFREVQSNNDTQWIIEAIFIEEMVVTNEIIEDFTIEMLELLELAPNDNPQLQYLPSASLGNSQVPNEPVPLLEVQTPDTTPLLSNAAFYFWEIYDITPFDNADSIQSNIDPEPQPHQYCDDYTALSYLSVGQQAQMSGYYYSRLPLSSDLSDNSRDDWLDLGDPIFFSEYYGFDFFTNMLKTNMYEPAPTTYDTDIEFYSGTELVMSHGAIFAPPQYGAPVAMIIDGPDCRSYDIRNYQECSNSTPCEYSENPDDRYVTWWQIELTVQGETSIGWYPENVTQYAWWLYENEGIFDRVITSYLLTPVGEAMTTSGDTCESLPDSRFASGTDVQPVEGAMNVRDNANGEVIGRVEANSLMTLVGEPECSNEVRWREVIFHEGSIERGWVAENDETVFYITTYIPPVETVDPELTRESDNSDGSTSQPSPESDPSGGRGNDSSTHPSPTPGLMIPIVPATAQPTDSSCDPATGRGC